MKTLAQICIFSLILQFIFQAQIQSQDRQLSIIEKFVYQRNSFSSSSYLIDLKHKSFSDEDTLSYVAHVDLIRNSKDLLYGGLFSIEILDTLWYGYDGHNIMQGSMHDSVLTTGNASTNPGLFVKSTWVDNFIDYGFLKMTPGPMAFINDSSIEKEFSDTTIAGWPCLGILFRLPDEEGFTRQRFFVAIDTIEFMVRNRMYSVSYQDNDQYTNWLYKESIYGTDSTLVRLGEDFLEGFKLVELYSPDLTYRDNINEFDFSLLTGKIYNRDETVNLSDLNATIFILDFWYTSCYPCIKSIPSVNKLYRDYKDRGVAVLGVNMLDDEVKSKGRLDKFFKNNLMEYTPLMVDRRMADQMGISSYPTLLILDKNFHIIHLEDGFSEDLYDKVASVLNENLR